MRCSQRACMSRRLLPPPPFPRHAGAAPAAPVAELGVVRRRYHLPVNDDESASPSRTPEQRVVEAASAILRGELGVIEGSRLLRSLQFEVSSLDLDPDFIPFIGIDSETDHLPIGEVRQLWAPDALVRLAPEIKAAEDKWRQRAFTAAQRLLDRFSSTSSDNTRNA